MIGLLLRASFKMLLLAAGLYVAFFVPLGEHTLARHVERIAQTAEARDLGRGVVDAAEHAQEAVSGQLGDAVARTPSAD